VLCVSAEPPRSAALSQWLRSNNGRGHISLLDQEDRVEETLAKAGIFQGVDPDAALALGSQLEQVDYARGSSIFSEGELGDRLYVILSG
jgi:CRP-like cAMP-binding protein